MELHHLRCAVAVADHRSFTAAATALHLTQPSLSYAIANLERELGTRLFDRAPSGTRLTAAGEAFVGPARLSIGEAERGRAAVDAVTGLVAGELRVMSIRTAVVETAARVAAFHARHPKVLVALIEPAGDDAVTEAVRTGRADLGVMRTDEIPADLVSTPMGVQQVVVVFPAAIAPRRRTVRMKELEGVPMVAPLDATPTRAAHDAVFRAAGVQPLVAAECSHLESVVELVRGGVGAVLTSDSRADTIHPDGLAVRPITPALRSDLAVASRRSGLSPAADAFLEQTYAPRFPD